MEKIEKIAKEERSLDIESSSRSKKIIDDGMRSRLKFEERWTGKENLLTFVSK
jgi:hypothetical protein